MFRSFLVAAILFTGSLTFADIRVDPKPAPPAKPAEMPPVHFVVLHKPGPKWKKGVDFREQPGVKDHIAHYAKLQEQGRLEMGGPYLDSSGGMMIAVLGETKESMTKFASEDPAVKSGLLRFEVKPWMVAMSKGK